MASGMLSLKWNNHKSTFFNVLSSIRSKENYCDATLACDGKLYLVHKFVLSTCSEYFEQIFEHVQSTHPVIVLKDIKGEDLESLMDYMYEGEVNVLQNKLSSLIKAAECLKIKGLAVPEDNCESEKSLDSQHSSEPSQHSPASKRRKKEVKNGSSLLVTTNVPDIVESDFQADKINCTNILDFDKDNSPCQSTIQSQMMKETSPKIDESSTKLNTNFEGIFVKDAEDIKEEPIEDVEVLNEEETGSTTTSNTEIFTPESFVAEAEENTNDCPPSSSNFEEDSFSNWEDLNASSIEGNTENTNCKNAIYFPTKSKIALFNTGRHITGRKKQIAQPKKMILKRKNKSKLAKKKIKSKPKRYIPLKTKFEIVKKNERGSSKEYIARELNVEESTVEKVLSRAERYKTISITPRKIPEIKKAKISIMNELEISLISWVEEIVKKEGNLTSEEVRAKALKVFSALSKKAEYLKYAKKISFMASEAWYYKFRKRLGHLSVKIKRK